MTRERTGLQVSACRLAGSCMYVCLYVHTYICVFVCVYEKHTQGTVVLSHSLASHAADYTDSRMASDRKLPPTPETVIE